MLFAFDLLFLDGHDLRSWKLENRRDALETVLAPPSQTLMLSKEVEGDGPTIFRHACEHGLEGITARALALPVRPT